MIYLDNAATSWPKPSCVQSAMIDFMQNIGANPGRSGHRLSIEAGQIVYDCREALADLVGLAQPMNVMFTANATEALNLATHSVVKPGDHVVTTSQEHNSVMRPLRYLESKGTIELSVLDIKHFQDVDYLAEQIKSNTRLIVMNHVSNVTGQILPVRTIGNFASDNDLLLLVDGAQSVGAVPVDIELDQIDMLAVTGHKALMGPMGTGALVVRDRVKKLLKPLKRGGTGSHSEHESQPEFLPDMCESGTLNTVGIAGLLAGINWVTDRGIESIFQNETHRIKTLINQLKSIPGVEIFTADSPNHQGSVFSVNIHGRSPSDIGLTLDEEFGIMTRVGLHCAPAAHHTIGTFPNGTVRLAPGIFTTDDDLDAVIHAVKQLSQRGTSP